ncbi:free fatty acid receptor 2-like [Elgaria multicarinata webbii]|uniref:free fatty acid receptor 2-like n=1 Tax=Elgaria multicarinata webbii TaxID=159646 RepID=UPI002FCCDAC3
MAHKNIVLAFYLAFFLTGLPCNILACYAFLRKVRQKAVPIDIILLNLTISDLFLLLFLPFKMVEAAFDNTWPLPAFLCPLANFFFYSSIYLSTLFLMGVSVERYLCIAHPVKHKLNHRPTYAKVASLFFWLLACSHCASIVYVVEYSDRTQRKLQDNSTCYVHFSDRQLAILLPFRLELCLVLFCLPFIITAFCYINIIRIVTSMPNIHPHKKQRAVGLAVATTLIFAIVFAPYNISHIVGFFQNESPSWRVETFFLASLNTTLDPIIFFLSSSTIRKTFANFWFGLCHNLQVVLLRCSSPCCRVPEDNEEEAGAGRSIPACLSTIFTTQQRSETSE